MEKRSEVLRRRGSDKDVRVAHADGTGDGDAHRRGLTATASGGEGDGGPQGFFAGCVEEGDHRLGLVQGFAARHQRARGFRLLQRALEVGEVLRVRGADALASDGLDVAHVGGDGEDVQLVVHHDAGGAAAKAQDEALVESPSHVLMALGAKSRVHVHRQRVQLAEGLEVAQEKDDDAAALNGLHGASQKVGGQRLKVLQHRHAVRVTQDVLSVLVVRVLDVRARHEEREGSSFSGSINPRDTIFLICFIRFFLCEER